MPGEIFGFKKRSQERNRRSAEAQIRQDLKSKLRWKEEAGDKIISVFIDNMMRDIGKKLLEHVVPTLSPVEQEFVLRKYPPAVEMERRAFEMLDCGGSREGRDALQEARDAITRAKYSLLAESVPEEQIRFLQFLVTMSTRPDRRHRLAGEGVRSADFYEFFTRNNLHLKVADALDSAGYMPNLSQVLRNLSIIT